MVQNLTRLLFGQLNSALFLRQQRDLLSQEVTSPNISTWGALADWTWLAQRKGREVSYKELRASGPKTETLEPTSASVKCFLLFGLAEAIGRVRLPMSDRLVARHT